MLNTNFVTGMKVRRDFFLDKGSQEIAYKGKDNVTQVLCMLES